MKTLKKAIVTNCSGMIDSPISLQLLDNHIVITDQGGDCNYKISSVESVSEITDLFFFKIKNSQIIIVPKSDEGLTSSIRKVIADHQLNHIINLDWKY
ncbi:MAG: YcxB family protein [Bacteroidota bacterium]